jgi:hypothetical protein
VREQFGRSGKGLVSEVVADFKVWGLYLTTIICHFLPLVHCACGWSAQHVTTIQYINQYELVTNNFAINKGSCIILELSQVKAYITSKKKPNMASMCQY